MKATAARAALAARWAVRLLVGLGLLLALAAAFLWWWAGQDGSLEWALKRIARGAPLQSEGVQGSLRSGWRIARISWERDGLRLEAEDIRLEWQPLAILNRTLQLEQVQVARARVIDKRPASGEPLREPSDLRLPWRVNVESLQVGAFAYEGRWTVEARRLDAGYHFDGLRHRLALQSLEVAGGEYRGEATLLALAPLTLDAQVSGRIAAPVPGAKEKVPVEFTLRAQGPANAIDASARLQVERAGAAAGSLPQGTATARLSPFAEFPLVRAEADVRRLDLALLWPQAPRTALSGHVEVVPAEASVFRLEADLRNDAAGPWDQKRLPVEALRAGGEWRRGTALLRSLEARAGGGRIEGSGRWRDGGWEFDGEVAQVDPARLHTRLAPLPLSGPLKLAGEGSAVDFDVLLQAGRMRGRSGEETLRAAVDALELRDLLAKGRYAGDTVRLSQLRVRTSDALLEGELAWQLAAHAGEGRLELQAPGLQAQARGNIAPTRGQGTATITSPDLAQARRWLARWPGAGAALADLQLRGQAKAEVAWQGGWRDPTVQARANVRALAWQPVPTAANATPPWTVREAELQLQGRLRDAALALSGQAEQGQRRVALAVDGRLGATLGGPVSWRGQVASASVQLVDPALTPGPWRLELQRPVDWRAAGGRFELGAGEALLRAPAMRSGAPASDAQVAWGPVRRQEGLLSTTGRIANLPLAWLEVLGGAQFGGAALAGDMVFDGRWDAQLGNTLRVDAALSRVRGDLMVQVEDLEGTRSRVAAGVRDARLTVRTQGGQLEFALLWDSERAGRVDGQLSSRLVREGEGWTWPEQAPVTGRVQAQLPRIGVWSVLAPPGWRLRGSLAADIRITGTRSQPDLSGPLRAEGLALRSVVDGIELRNGLLRAQLAGRRLVVEEFRLHGSPEGGSDGGSLVAKGEAAWTPQGVVLQAEATLSQLRASIRADRQLTVSGPVAARVEGGLTTVSGNLRVDRARIVIPEETAPRLGEDVVVRNAPGVASTEAERRQKPPPAGEARSKLDLKVGFDLGTDFRLSGRGVDTRLAGKVEVQADAAGTPRLVGVIQAVGGTYQAYGQRMNIERGELRFTGPPDNPALDILAVRPNMIQKVGVQVTGRAQAPHVELYSDAGLSDAEILSYIVLGRSSSGSGAEAALLQRAAAALVAGRRGTGKGIAGSLGLDDISVSPDSTSGAVVRVGKRFADNFYAAYERSLQGAMGTLYLFYDVSRRLTVRAEAGERTGVDLIFTFTF